MAALAIVLLVPLAVGWLVERMAYGEVRATEAVVAPLQGVLHGSATLVNVPLVPLAEAPAEPPAGVEAQTVVVTKPR